MREGIGHDGRALFPIMAYERFRSMSDEDLASVVVYLRSLPPVQHELSKTEIIFPVKYLIRNVPEPINAPVAAPDPSDRTAWGKYLVTIAGCEDCHSPNDAHGQPIPGMSFAGGFSHFERREGCRRQSDAGCHRGQLLRRSFVPEGDADRLCGRKKLSSLMPFPFYGNMTDEDLKAIFAYLRTISPVKHRVDNSLPVSYCKLCKQWHGAGDQN